MKVTIDESDLKNYEYFRKGEVPCFFLVEVQEGFARFDIRSREQLAIMLKYLAENAYQVEWTSAVVKEDTVLEEYDGFPGGKYVAHRTDLSRFVAPPDVGA